ncbi:MAG: DUF2339 domain-containing protein [Eubacteriaceae bacterium]|nr:DUF2339 domain-containing protein [Eubacteriaceae bacterium]
MDTANNLEKIIERQKEVLLELEAELKALVNSDLAQENTRLKEEIGKLGAEFEKALAETSTLASENASLKNALYSQIYNEKIRLVNSTAQKLEVYFASGIQGELNKLSAFERRVLARINGVRDSLAMENFQARDEILEKADELSALLDTKLSEAKEKAANAPRPFSNAEREELEALKNSQITDGQIRAAATKNNFERFVGLNVLNAIGVFLLIIGAIALAQLTYIYLPDTLKGIILFALGGVMLAAGEALNRKKPNVFSLGISAGGVGILYAAIATSYFTLKILGMYPALAVCALTTVGSFVLSARYNSQTIAAFALIGGYLPMYSIDTSKAVLYGAMAYYAALNLFALSISFSKKWQAASFIGLFLNIFGTFYVCFSFYGTKSNLEKALVLCYALFAFLVYTAIPVISTYRTKGSFGVSDIALLAINTFFSSVVMYFVFNNFGFKSFNGLLAIAFGVVYLLFGRLVDKLFQEEKKQPASLFYLAGLVFAVLVIPLQFGRIWLSLGWLVQGVLLASFGIISGQERIKNAGFAVCLLCLGSFVLFDATSMRHYLFAYKYFAITLGSCIVLGAYIAAKKITGKFASRYKYFVMGNVWLYAMYLAPKLFSRAFGIDSAYDASYLANALRVALAFALAYIFPRIKPLSDNGTTRLSAALYMFGVWFLYNVNKYLSPVRYIYLAGNSPQLRITVVAVLILAVIGALSVFAMRELAKMLVAGKKPSVEWYPLIVSGYFLALLTQNLTSQFNLPFSSFAISIIYVVAALSWIVYGFSQRYSLIRKAGLGLAILSVFKLFLVDLAGLVQSYRIVSYFALGITLIAISFVYQYFNKRLELLEGVEFDEEKDD